MERKRSMLVALLLGFGLTFGSPILAPLSGITALAHAQGAYQEGTAGFDVSIPQCRGWNIPAAAPSGATYEFAVIGVNGGRAFTQNPCLAREYQAVADRGLAPSLYMNLNSPRGQISSYQQLGPHGTCANSDSLCQSYNYGWNAAQYAYGYAQATLQSLDVSSMPTAWWLDVETMNYWSPDESANVRTIQGAVDYLRSVGTGTTVGVYSIPSMWQQIAGTFTQQDLPAWVAGAHSLAGASRLCLPRSFTGGPTWLVQFTNGVNGLLDENYAC